MNTDLKGAAENLKLTSYPDPRIFEITDMVEPLSFHTIMEPSSSALTSVSPSDARSLIGAECSGGKNIGLTFNLNAFQNSM